MDKIKAIFLDFKKKLFSLLGIPLYTKEQKQLFDSISVGDIVHCKMPLSETELLKIPEGHKYRPYLVASIKGNKLICFPGSHKKWPNTPLSKTLVIRKVVFPTYTNSKGIQVKNNFDSYFDLLNTSFIPIENIEFISQHVNHHYMNELGIKNRIMANQGEIVFNVQYPFVYTIKEGMVYEYENKYYYLHKVDGEQLYGYTINDEKNGISFNFLGNNLYLHYELKANFIDDGTFPIVWYCSKEQIDELAEKVREEKRLDREENKKTQPYHFKYPFRTQFYMPFLDDTIVYLFSITNKHYVVYLDDPYTITKVKDFQYYHKKTEKYPEEDMLEMLYQMQNLKINSHFRDIIIDLMNKIEKDG